MVSNIKMNSLFLNIRLQPEILKWKINIFMMQWIKWKILRSKLKKQIKGYKIKNKLAYLSLLYFHFRYLRLAMNYVIHNVLFLFTWFQEFLLRYLLVKCRMNYFFIPMNHPDMLKSIATNLLLLFYSIFVRNFVSKKNFFFLN